ncbi:MAG: glycosidase [Thermoguttaceae bacterium]|jgi:predicted GH43/DUF377 family glycosyl hydrolase
MNHLQERDILFKRHPANPILTARAWPYVVNTIFNAGAARLADGAILLLCRAEDRRGVSHLCAARSKNGVDGWIIDPAPTLLPDPEKHAEETWGIEDPRITFLEGIGKYAVVYSSYSKLGPGVSLALTEDFRQFARFGQIMPPENKDAALLPKQIGSHWALIHRPVSPLGAHIWISYSPDLRHWGAHKPVILARRGSWWDSGRIGLSAPPIETPVGWLLIYHGVKETVSGKLYRVGLALLDRERPEVCLRRGDAWVFGPATDYERSGDVGNVVFPCGSILESDGDTLHLYYGAADTCIALATGSVKQMLKWLDQHGKDVNAGLE